MKAIPPGKWIWYGHAGHFICGRWCRFHLATKVGKYLVSTVGEYWPERAVREIHAQVHDPAWLIENGQLLGDEFDNAYMKRFGYEEIGMDRKFETMVFVAGRPCRIPDCNCGLPTIYSSEIDMQSYSIAGEAAAGHIDLCFKWANPTEDMIEQGKEGVRQSQRSKRWWEEYKKDQRPFLDAIKERLGDTGWPKSEEV